MGVISVRLSQDEDRILKKLMDHYNMDKSGVIKKSLRELYENVVDLEFVEEFEKREKQGKVSFVGVEEILGHK